MRQTSTVKRAAVKSPAKSRLEIPSAETTSVQGDFYQKVQEKAYALYVARGCADGYDVEDWLAAEQIVKDT